MHMRLSRAMAVAVTIISRCWTSKRTWSKEPSHWGNENSFTPAMQSFARNSKFRWGGVFCLFCHIEHENDMEHDDAVASPTMHHIRNRITRHMLFHRIAGAMPFVCDQSSKSRRKSIRALPSLTKKPQPTGYRKFHFGMWVTEMQLSSSKLERDDGEFDRLFAHARLWHYLAERMQRSGKRSG